jgi:hypothetical protein
MTRSNQNFPREDDRYIAGDTLTLEVTVTNDSGDPKDLTEADVVFALAEYSSQDPLIEKTIGSGVDLVSPADGRLNVQISGSETSELGTARGQEYYYEITIRDNSKREATVTTGEWTIHADTAIF